MRLSEICVQRPVFAFMLIMFLVTLGVFSFMGLNVDLFPRTDPATLESERSGLYLAGVIVAGMHTSEIFIENGRFHGKLIAESIASRQTHLKH